jgi:HEAT repeat protein
MKRKWFQTSVGRLILLVGCCAVIAWAWRSVRESLRKETAQDWARVLQTGSVADRKTAAGMLGSARGDSTVAVSALVTALEDKDPTVRAQVALSLGNAAASSATLYKNAVAAQLRDAAKGLLGAIERDNDPSVRSAAVFALAALLRATGDAGIFQDKSLVSDPLDPATAVAPLSSAMERDPENRLSFLVAFGSMGHFSVAAPVPLLAALDDPSMTIREKALIALSQFASGIDRAVPVLLRDAETEGRRSKPSVSRDHETSSYFAAAREMNPSPAVVPALVDALASENRHVRGVAAVLLGRIGPDARPASPALIAGMRRSIVSQEGSTRLGDSLVFDFAPAVARVASPDETLSILGEALRSGSFWAKSVAGSVLAKLGPQAQAAIPALIAAMNDAKEAEAKPDEPGSGYAISVAAALGRIAQQSPLPKPALDGVIFALSEGLSLKHSGVRRECAAALGNLGPRAAAALPALRLLQSDEFRTVREEAETAVNKIVP